MSAHIIAQSKGTQDPDGYIEKMIDALIKHSKVKYTKL
jgi:hypothetical protein